jgi:hypothetical protein
VIDVIKKFEQMKDFHVWLKDRQAKQYYIPETREELMQIYKVERPSFMMKRSGNTFRKYSKAQMKHA